MRVHYLQHVPFEDPAMIFDWAESKGYSISGTRLFENEKPPKPYEVDFLLVMGGPMNIYEEMEHPWLKTEKNFIDQCIDRGVKTLGICLGAQLIADVLGGRVKANGEKEIGWFPVKCTTDAASSPFFSHMPASFEVLHWHGDTFTTPHECKHLASSGVCANQAFSFEDHVLGLQFHLEFTPERVEAILKNCGHELVDAPYIQSAEEIRMHCETKLEESNQLMTSILDVMQEL